MTNKKHLFLLTSILIGNIAFADYRVKVPLETQNGGNLPTGSIHLGGTNEVEPPEDNGVWSSTSPLYSSWINSGSVYNCLTWNPDTNTVGKGISFTQTSNDCSQDQTRTRQNREQNSLTNDYRNVGSPIIEYNTLNNETSTRNSVGTLENWISISPITSSWTNNGVLYDCTNWTPDPSTVTSGQPFDQTATDCKQDQTRTSQAREQETNTSEIRNVGSAIVENQTLINQSNIRSSVGTKAAQVCNSYSGSNNWTVDLFVTYIYWGGTQIGFPDSSSTTYNSGGYKYTRGTFYTSSNQDMGTIYYYGVCREPL